MRSWPPPGTYICNSSSDSAKLLRLKATPTLCGPAVAEKRMQVYGTQFTAGRSGPEPQPIEDPEGVDERRAAVGLEPLAEYQEHFPR